MAWQQVLHKSVAEGEDADGAQEIVERDDVVRAGLAQITVAQAKEVMFDELAALNMSKLHTIPLMQDLKDLGLSNLVIFSGRALTVLWNRVVSSEQACVLEQTISENYDGEGLEELWLRALTLGQAQAPTCRYTVLGVLGEGSFGKLYKVRDSVDGTEKALKTATDPLCTDVRISAAETDIHMRLRHPYLLPGLDVVRLEDVGACPELQSVQQGVLLPLMDYDLHHFERNRSKYPVFNALRASWQLACALEALHAAGYCHLDIKPQNILQKGDTTVLSDFGLAYWNTTPALNRMVVSLYHRPPYVLYGRPTPSELYMPIDVYSLGLTFMDITCEGSRPDLDLYYNDTNTVQQNRDGENRFVVDQQVKAHARLDQLIAWMPQHTPQQLPGRQERWHLPLPSVDAFIAYLQLIKDMTTATPAAAPSATDVRLRLEALWSAYPPLPALRLEPNPPGADEYREAATFFLSYLHIDNERAVHHTVELFLAVMTFATPSKETYSVYQARVSWKLAYLLACLNIALSFYDIKPYTSFRFIPYNPKVDLLFDTMYAGASVAGDVALCNATKVIAASDVLRGRYNFVLPGDRNKAAMLRQAVEEGNLGLCTSLLDEGVPASAEGLLETAVYAGDVWIVQLLMRFGAKLTDEAVLIAVDKQMLSILDVLVGAKEADFLNAVKRGDADDVQAALKGVDVHVRGDIALYIAAVHGRLDVVKVLLRAGESVQQEHIEAAMDNGHLDVAIAIGE